MKKSQILGIPIIYLMFSLIAVAVLVIGIIGVRHLAESSKETQLSNFLLTLQNKLSVTRLSTNKISQETYALPSDVESVCFVDNTHQFIPYTNKELNEKMEMFSDKNLFLEPFSSYAPYSVQYITISEFENPLCVKTIDGKLSLKLEGEGNATRVSALNPLEKENECISVIYNEPYNGSIDVVFLGFKYKNTKDFSADVNKYVNSVFLAAEPFSLHKDKINIYRVDDFNLDCEIVKGINYIRCNSYETNIMASNCPHDYIIVLMDQNFAADLVNPVRSSAIGNIVKINTKDNANVLIHELGHSIGGLADEYVEPSYTDFSTDNYPNCGTTCKWSAIPGAGCYGGMPDGDKNGCSIDTAFRGTETSIMKELKGGYGPVNTIYMMDVISKYE
ncbi:MAG: M64 family metallopeptidase [Nanoarchaeota archaeon]